MLLESPEKDADCSSFSHVLLIMLSYSCEQFYLKRGYYPVALYDLYDLVFEAHLEWTRSIWTDLISSASLVKILCYF